MGLRRAAALLLLFFQVFPETQETLFNEVDIHYWRCIWKRANTCPDEDIKYYLYTRKGSFRSRALVSIPGSLEKIGWDRRKENVIIIHGHNGTDGKTPLTLLRDAYLIRGDHNVFVADWGKLTRFPCYLSAIHNLRFVSQCTAQLFAHLTHQGASMKGITCIGHSLGAHVCGMVGNHATIRPHRIIALDPARPVIEEVNSMAYRLSADDADSVEVIHTNAGFLGMNAPCGTVDFCVNGGHFQQQCDVINHPIRRNKCSHFQGVCLLASVVASRKHKKIMGYPCSRGCSMGRATKYRPGKPIPMGQDKALPGARGTYCIDIVQNMCPFV
ncbi:phospholipase A1-like [Hetaerina americana]|uniref:phospholipase A1-like n=1 Tax=Hetaerina americana TaxID=62018 RepID=UPI003A7F2656